MLATAVSQKAAWVLMLRSLMYSVSKMLIDGRPAQKIQRICFGANGVACNVWGTKQQLGDVSSCLDAGKCFIAECCGGAGAAAAD